MNCDHYCVSGHLVKSHDSEDTGACHSFDEAALLGTLACDRCDRNPQRSVRVLMSYPDRYGLMLLQLTTERQRLRIVLSLN